MIYIEQAVLHIVDGASGNIFYAAAPLDLAEAGVARYLEKLLQHFLKQDLRAGDLPEAHWLKNIAFTATDFMTTSQTLSEQLYQLTAPQAEIPRGDLLCVRYTEADNTYFALLKLNHGQAYTHFLNYTDDGIANEIILNQAVLPAVQRKISEGFSLNVTTGHYVLADQAFPVDGEKVAYFSQLFLQLPAPLTATEQVKEVKAAVTAVAEDFSQDTFTATSQAQTTLYQQLDQAETVDLSALAAAVFPTEAAQTALTERLTEQVPAPQPLAADPKVKRHLSKQRLKLDNGVELIVPQSVYQDPDQIAFINQPDGTISVVLKQIGSIENKF